MNIFTGKLAKITDKYIISDLIWLFTPFLFLKYHDLSFNIETQIKVVLYAVITYLCAGCLIKLYHYESFRQNPVWKKIAINALPVCLLILSINLLKNFLPQNSFILLITLLAFLSLQYRLTNNQQSKNDLLTLGVTYLKNFLLVFTSFNLVIAPDKVTSGIISIIFAFLPTAFFSGRIFSSKVKKLCWQLKVPAILYFLANIFIGAFAFLQVLPMQYLLIILSVPLIFKMTANKESSITPALLAYSNKLNNLIYSLYIVIFIVLGIIN